jgi:repressor LexA
MSPTPNRDDEHLGKLRDYYARWRSLPSYARLAAVLGMGTRAAVMKALRRLREGEYLDRTPDGAWIPGQRFFERPLADFAVPAGAPVVADEARGGGFALDEYLVRTPSLTSFVPVRGDSMTGAGIFDGDLAVVERRSDAAKGDLVVAVVDGELTLKRLGRERGAFVLRPENPAYPVIRPRGALEIFGVVVGVVRRVRR